MGGEQLEQQKDILPTGEVVDVLANGKLKDNDFQYSSECIGNNIVPASNEKKILGTDALVGKEAQLFMESNKKLNKLLHPSKINKFGGSKESQAVVVYNNIVFFVPEDDLKNDTSFQEAQDFALQTLNDIARTEIGVFILNKLKTKYQQGNNENFIKVKMRGGHITGEKELYLDSQYTNELVNGNLQGVPKKAIKRAPISGGAGSGANRGGIITWPYQYGRYHYNQEAGYNNNGKIIATAPSEVIFHEFVHEFNSYDFVKEYLEYQASKGNYYDINNDNVPDINQGMLPMKQASHTGSSASGIFFGYPEAATYFEQIFVYEKKKLGFSDHDPRPTYKDGVKGLKRIPVRVNNASLVRPHQE